MTNSVNPPGPGLHWQKRSRIYCQHRQSGGGNTPAPGSAPRRAPARPCARRPRAHARHRTTKEAAAERGQEREEGAEEGSAGSRQAGSRRAGGGSGTHTDRAPGARTRTDRHRAAVCQGRERPSGEPGAGGGREAPQPPRRSGAQRSVSPDSALSPPAAAASVPREAGRAHPAPPPAPVPLRAGRPAGLCPVRLLLAAREPELPHGEAWGAPAPPPASSSRIPAEPGDGWVGMCARVCGESYRHMQKRQREREICTRTGLSVAPLAAPGRLWSPRTPKKWGWLPGGGGPAPSAAPAPSPRRAGGRSSPRNMPTPGTTLRVRLRAAPPARPSARGRERRRTTANPTADCFDWRSIQQMNADVGTGRGSGRERARDEEGAGRSGWRGWEL